MAAIHQPRVAYADYEVMLADPQVEAVIVATSDQFHVPLALKAIAAGKHVLVEKPLGVTVEECEELRNRLQGTGLILQIGFNKRFDPGLPSRGTLSRRRSARCSHSKHGTATRRIATP